MSARNLGPIITDGAIEEAIVRCLKQPQVLGIYIDEAARQTYNGVEARVRRPQDIVRATESTIRLNMPAVIVSVEGDGDTRPTADRAVSATYVVGVHCLESGGDQQTCRRTADIIGAAVKAALLQRLPGTPIGLDQQTQVADIQWTGGAMADPPATQPNAAYADRVVEFRVTVPDVVSAERGVLPDLPPNVPDTDGPAPEPGFHTVIVDLPVEIEDPQP